MNHMMKREIPTQSNVFHFPFLNPLPDRLNQESWLKGPERWTAWRSSTKFVVFTKYFGPRSLILLQEIRVETHKMWFVLILLRLLRSPNLRVLFQSIQNFRILESKMKCNQQRWTHSKIKARDAKWLLNKFASGFKSNKTISGERWQGASLLQCLSLVREVVTETITCESYTKHSNRSRRHSSLRRPLKTRNHNVVWKKN